MKVQKRAMVALVVCGVFVLSGCQSKEEKQVAKEKKEFTLLYEYNEDKVRPVIEQKKTPEELVEDIVMEELGLSTDTERYKERGVLKGQGIFIESAIRDGADIPQVSAVPLEERDKMVDDDAVSEEEKRKEFEELVAQRRKVLKDQYKTDEQDKEALLAEVKKRVERQEKRGQAGEQIGVSENEQAEDDVWE